MTAPSNESLCNSLCLKIVLVALLSTQLVLLTGCGGSGVASDPPTPARMQTTILPTNNTLVAEYSITTSAAGTVAVQFGPDTNYGFQTSSQTAPGGGFPVDILVAGMKQNTLYHMRAVLTSSSGQTFDQDHTFQTGVAPASDLPQMHITIPPGQTPSPGVELVSMGGATMAINPTGDILWYYPYAGTGGPNLVKLLPNGHMLMLLTLPGPAGNTGIREVDLAGNIIRELDLSVLKKLVLDAGYNLQLESIDHDVLLLPNGDLLFITTDYRVFTNLPGYPGQITVAGNAIIDVNQDNNVVWVWDAFDHLDVNRHPMNFPDWTHSNALAYSTDDNNLLLSIRHQHWVIKIDYRNGTGSGDILWKLGYQGDFTLLDSTSPADWFYAQHDANFMSPNTTGDFQLALFDNGDNRVLDDNGDVCHPTSPPKCYSTAAIFEVNETNRTAKRQWSYQTPYSFWGGSSQELTNSNMFATESAPNDLMAGSRLVEVTQQPNPTVVWQLEMYNQQSYRTYHLPSLYPGVQW